MCFEKSRNVNISFEASLLMRKCKQKVFEKYLLSEKCCIGHSDQYWKKSCEHIQIQKLKGFSRILLL